MFQSTFMKNEQGLEHAASYFIVQFADLHFIRCCWWLAGLLVNLSDGNIDKLTG